MYFVRSLRTVPGVGSIMRTLIGSTLSVVHASGCGDAVASVEEAGSSSLLLVVDLESSLLLRLGDEPSCCSAEASFCMSVASGALFSFAGLGSPISIASVHTIDELSGRSR